MNQIIYTDGDRNSIRFSDFKKLESDCAFYGLGVKYVDAGEEVYYANDKKYKVKVGEYLIGNESTKSIVQINNKTSVKGLCIDISPEIITEVAGFYDVYGSELKDFLLSDQFFVNCYGIKNNSLGHFLQQIADKIKRGTFFNNFQKSEFFYSLAESMIRDQRFIFDHLSRLNFKKKMTNEEIFRNVLDAKRFIEEHLTENPCLGTMAREIGVSKYHFIRVFKSVFGISPYQYQKCKRLEMARLDLLKGKDISCTAMRFGFPDVPAFSKAFKQQFGQTPASVKISNF